MNTTLQLNVEGRMNSQKLIILKVERVDGGKIDRVNGNQGVKLIMYLKIWKTNLEFYV
jgi:hypothetical protein